MSSHREAPEISKDPVADSADVYAFVSPDKPDTTTLIATYIPMQSPAGGPNFFEFGDDVLYQIHIDNNGDGRADVRYDFRFTAKNAVGGTFLYNVGPIQALNSPNWNRRQVYSVARWTPEDYEVLAENVPCPPCNIGPLSTPNFAALSASARSASGRRAPRARGSSPARWPTASTSISARCSTSPTCARSSSCTPSTA
jgi:hypothetical protein